MSAFYDLIYLYANSSGAHDVSLHITNNTFWETPLPVVEDDFNDLFD